ncbi:DUF6760 family protein [Romeriopsis navalis]|nr:DUF6760 family protein [Romeriopsis navalis]
MAFHFHWSLDSIFQLEHHDRRRWIQEIQMITSTKDELS